MISQGASGHYCCRGDAVIRSLGVRKETGVTQRKIATTRRPNRPSDRIERARVDKFSARRSELAEAALETLAELGYARTSLREIAQKSEFTHGVLHYYFSDKVDLICCCVRHYKAKCVTRYDQITSDRKSTRLNSSHRTSSYAVFCLKKKKHKQDVFLQYSKNPKRNYGLQILNSLN